MTAEPSGGMQPRHAIALGSTAVPVIAAVLKFYVLLTIAIFSKTAAPAFDDPTALAHAALIVWGVSAWAMAKHVDIPPMLVQAPRVPPPGKEITHE